MKKIGLHEIRKEFLDFFEGKGHLILPSFSLVPQNDKSLLLINAGMAPLKPYFTGEKKPPRERVATCQKCIRTADIENVGKTDRHATFFEMLGNFSFGNYFKKEAIQWAWEFLTVNMEIPKELLWVSIYEEDDEAFEIWKNEVGVPAEKIVRLGKEDNFWELEVGPCGPCSEIYVDRGEKYGCGKEDCEPGCDCDRYIEVWNLVFTQFDKDENGNYHPLDHPNIDTGMGLERIATVMEGTDNIFEVGEIKKIINIVEREAGKKYGQKYEWDVSIRVITDHARAMTFLVSDGVIPSNEGRGYVLRRLIRRAARHGKLLGIEKPFLSSVVSGVIESWKVTYPEIDVNKERILKVIRAEEEKFQETIHQGIQILDNYIEEIKNKNQKYLDGEKAFKLYDTYGFPLDLTREILEEKGLAVDEEEFNFHMEEQRKRARKARERSTDAGWKHGEIIDFSKEIDTEFKGYESLDTNSRVVEIIIDGSSTGTIKEGMEGIIVLDQTPFYAERGGQVGDKGIFRNNNFLAHVVDTQYAKDDIIIHYIKVDKGVLNIGDSVEAQVDYNYRHDVMRNHSATHLLHRALKDVLGEHVNQAGSIVLPDRLRFDFTHFEAVQEEELKEIERIVNEKILEALEVKTIETSLEKAQAAGVVGLFEEKYKDKVRVVQMGDYSKELCGGTHVNNTSFIGMFKIISESSIAAGVRRIEAITGRAVYNYLLGLEEDLNNISQIMKVNRKDLSSKVQNIMEELKSKEKEIEALKAKMASSIVDEILNSKQNINNIDYIACKVENMDMNSLRNLGDKLKDSLGSGVIVLSSVDNNKIYFLCAVTKDLVEKGIHAGNIIKEVAKVAGGGGGGRPDMAQAGGKDVSKVDEALNKVPSILEEQLK
ncbi:MAG: alanine--tRNA ligase [Tissierellia bacterium]|nr:alanine--tRNA ligase [Tissierellia bacterium]